MENEIIEKKRKLLDQIEKANEAIQALEKIDFNNKINLTFSVRDTSKNEYCFGEEFFSEENKKELIFNAREMAIANQLNIKAKAEEAYRQTIQINIG